MSDPKDNVWPDKLRIRDTQLHDDIGGAGMRIYTTAGQGYEKVVYYRGDLLAAKDAEIERLEASVSGLKQNRDIAYEKEKRLRGALEEVFMEASKGSPNMDSIFLVAEQALKENVRDASCLDAGCDIDGKEPHKPWCDNVKENASQSSIAPST